MIRLRLLGGASIEQDGTVVRGRAAQNHHLALLAVLAAAPGFTTGRERLIGLLWGDLETRKARHRLSVALHVVRRQLGLDCLLTSGDAVTLNSERIASDLADFLQAIEEGLLEKAVGLYGGPLLAGLYLSGALEFERWTDSESERIAGLYRAALERLIREAESQRGPEAAGEWWQRLSAHNPFSASAAIGYMRALEASGDLAAALRFARAHVSRVEGELGIGANPKVVAFADELASRARARRDSTVSTTHVDRTPADPPGPAAAVSPEPDELEAGSGGETTTDRERRSFPRSTVRFAGAVTLAVLTWIAIDATAGSTTTAAPGVSIVPTAPTGVSEAQLRLTQWLSSDLERTLAIVPDLEVRQERLSPRGERAALAARVSRASGLKDVVTIEVQPLDGGARVSASFFDGPSGQVRWSRRFDAEVDDTAAVVADLSLAIANDLRLLLAPYAPHHYTDSDAANRNFLAGVFEHRRLTAETLWIALQHYRRAWEEDPNFALAHAIAGVAYMALTSHGLAKEVGFENAREHIRDALELDPGLAEGYSSLGRLQFRWDHDFDAAEESFRRAMMLYPTHPDAHTEYAFYLLYVRGQGDAAVASVRRSLELDPLNTARSAAVERVLYQARRYEEIPQQHQHTWSLDADVARTLPAPLGDAYREMGMYHESVEAIQEMHERRGGLVPSGLAVTYARIGRTGDARAILSEHAAVATETGRGLVGVARIYANLDEPDSAFVWLERTYEADRTAILSIATDPAFDPLRSDPRFRDLLQRIGLATEPVRRGPPAPA